MFLYSTKSIFHLIDQNSLLPENYTEAGDLAEITCAQPEDSLLEMVPLLDNLDDDEEDETFTLFCRYPPTDEAPFGRFVFYKKL